MKANMRVMCSVCGKTFLPGNTKGLPNVIGIHAAGRYSVQYVCSVHY